MITLFIFTGNNPKSFIRVLHKRAKFFSNLLQIWIYGFYNKFLLFAIRIRYHNILFIKSRIATGLSGRKLDFFTGNFLSFCHTFQCLIHAYNLFDFLCRLYYFGFLCLKENLFSPIIGNLLCLATRRNHPHHNHRSH